MMHDARDRRGPCVALWVATPSTPAEVATVLRTLDDPTVTSGEWLEAFDALGRAAFPELDDQVY